MISGSNGPDAKTYSQLQREELELDGSIRSRKPGLEMPVLPPGEVPRVPGGYVWDNVDRGPAPKEGDSDAA